MHQSVVFPRGGVSGIPMGFDSYLLPLGEEFDNNMSPRCREFEKFNLAFNLASLKMCGQRQFWWETAPNFSFVHDFLEIFLHTFSLFGNRNMF
jgi:hypothetical protein